MNPERCDKKLLSVKRTPFVRAFYRFCYFFPLVVVPPRRPLLLNNPVWRCCWRHWEWLTDREPIKREHFDPFRRFFPCFWAFQVRLRGRSRPPRGRGGAKDRMRMTLDSTGNAHLLSKRSGTNTRLFSSFIDFYWQILLIKNIIRCMTLIIE